VEKEGTFTQTQRMVQWRDKAVDPTGDQRSDLWFFYHLGRMVKERLAASTDPRDEPVQKLDWSYEVHPGVAGDAWVEPSAEDVLRRINGYDVATGKAVDSYLELKADGSGEASQPPACADGAGARGAGSAAGRVRLRGRRPGGRQSGPTHRAGAQDHRHAGGPRCRRGSSALRHPGLSCPEPVSPSAGGQLSHRYCCAD